MRRVLARARDELVLRSRLRRRCCGISAWAIFTHEGGMNDLVAKGKATGVDFQAKVELFCNLVIRKN